jgi:hypothetical protein
VPTSVRRRSFAHVDICEDSSGKVGVGRSCNAVLVQSLLSPSGRSRPRGKSTILSTSFSAVCSVQLLALLEQDQGESIEGPP